VFLAERPEESAIFDAVMTSNSDHAAGLCHAPAYEFLGKLTVQLTFRMAKLA
jgi:hypothetical protein